MRIGMRRMRGGRRMGRGWRSYPIKSARRLFIGRNFAEEAKTILPPTTESIFIHMGHLRCVLKRDKSSLPLLEFQLQMLLVSLMHPTMAGYRPMTATTVRNEDLRDTITTKGSGRTTNSSCLLAR